MDIRFCDLCQESVPEADFVTGRARTLNGRVVCFQCEQAMGGGEAPGAGEPPAGVTAGTTAGATAGASPPRPKDADVAASTVPAAVPAAGPAPVPSTGSGGAGRGWPLLALGAAAAVAFGAPLLLGRIEDLEGRLARSEQALEESARRQRAERRASLQPLAEAVDAVDERTRSAATELRGELEEQLARLEEALDRAEASSLSRGDRLRAGVDAASAAVTQLREEMARAREREREVAELKRLLSFHGDQLVDLEERLRSATVVAEAASGRAPAAAPSVGSNGGPMPEWAKHVDDLGSPDPGLRLDAVFALGQSKDLAVASHVAPMLGDEDVFVRMVSAQVLGALKAKVAVPALIEVLADDSSAVREAAVVSLRAITGEKFDFDPAGRTQDRGRALEAWRAWWRRSGDAFLTS